MNSRGIRGDEVVFNIKEAEIHFISIRALMIKLFAY
jgi:hypothetical protein